MSVIERLRSTQVSARAAAVCIIAVLLASIVVVITAKNVVSNQQPRLSQREGDSEVNKARVRVNELDGQPPKAGSNTRASSEKNPSNKDPYAIIVERNLFKPLGGSKPKSGDTSPKPPAPGNQESLLPMFVAMPPDVSFDEIKKQIVFTGVVATADGIQALLENLSTQETRFVAVGDSAFGCRVVSISPREVLLNEGGAQFTLKIGENKPDVPATGKEKPQSDKDKKPPEPPRPGGPPKK